jgi:hypothetical protein
MLGTGYLIPMVCDTFRYCDLGSLGEPPFLDTAGWYLRINSHSDEDRKNVTVRAPVLASSAGSLLVVDY